MSADADRIYFRQLLSGRDIAKGDMMARQMVNFVYLIGDRQTGEAIVIDPAYDPAGIVAAATEDGMRLVGAMATHYHQDHVGGNIFGQQIHGVAELVGLQPMPVHVQSEEAAGVAKVTGLSMTDLVQHSSGDVVTVGEIDVELIHTPGHTPGSQCFLVDGALVAGDTLFLEGCGRVDLPGGDAEQLYYSITQRLAKVGDDTVLYPGHLYAPEPSAPMGEVRSSNFVFRLQSLEQWKMFMGG
ncbi:MAG: MBL fold metallo-hydrolase [Acidimicrobiia bacterium]|nr:MBL fold metallo-hydrolase [Acidimicrobiia bacterium]